MGLVDTIRDLYEKKGLDAVWAWCMDGKGAREKAERFGAAAEFAGNRKLHPSKGDPDWPRVQDRYRQERDRFERKAEEHREPDWNGHKPVLGALGERVVLKANALGCIVTSTNDGTHTATSYHYTNHAIDFGTGNGEVGPKIELQKWLFGEYPEALELFGPLNDRCIKNGQRITLTEGSDLENLHDTHTHWAHT